MKTRFPPYALIRHQLSRPRGSDMYADLPSPLKDRASPFYGSRKGCTVGQARPRPPAWPRRIFPSREVFRAATLGHADLAAPAALQNLPLAVLARDALHRKHPEMFFFCTSH